MPKDTRKGRREAGNKAKIKNQTIRFCVNEAHPHCRNLGDRVEHIF